MAVRRNILDLSDADQQKFIAGLRTMKIHGTYDPFIKVHAAATRWTTWFGHQLDAAHGGPAFLPWHRKFLLTFEAQLQSAMNDTEFGLPYYDWTDGLGANSPVWGPRLMGGGGTPVTTGPFRNWTIINGFGGRTSVRLNRELGSGEERNLPTRAAVHRLMYLRSYDVLPTDDEGPSQDSMRVVLEGFTDPLGLHNLVHMWVGGEMANIPLACNDPIFFLHHCNVDRIWAEWQLVNPDSPYVPMEAGPDGEEFEGQKFEDAMYPWQTRPNIATPSSMQSIARLGYSYDRYYQIQTLQIVITTGSNLFAGTDNDVVFGLRSGQEHGPFWSTILDAGHCDHPNPFERGQTDTFTYMYVGNQQSGSAVPLTPAVLDVFSLGKEPGSWFGNGDWTVAGLKIVADGLVLYDNQKLNQELNSRRQHLNDGHGNALSSKP